MPSTPAGTRRCMDIPSVPLSLREYGCWAKQSMRSATTGNAKTVTTHFRKILLSSCTEPNAHESFSYPSRKRKRRTRRALAYASGSDRNAPHQLTPEHGRMRPPGLFLCLGKALVRRSGETAGIDWGADLAIEVVSVRRLASLLEWQQEVQPGAR